MDTNDKPRVLVVDDEDAVSRMLVRALGRHGYEVDAEGEAEAALARVAQTRYAAAVVDLVMPGRNGVELTRALRAALPGLPVAVLTGYPNSPLIKQARDAGARVFSKPVAVEELVSYLEAELPRAS